MAKKKTLVKSALLSKADAVKIKYNDLNELFTEVYKELEHSSNKDIALSFISNVLECVLYIESKTSGVSKALNNLGFDVNTSNFYTDTFVKLCEENGLNVSNIDDFSFDISNTNSFSSVLYEFIKGCIRYKAELLIDSRFVNNVRVANLYENLLAKVDEKTSKDTGVVYTPKSIAEFMCLDTLALYLYKVLNKGVELSIIKSLLLNDESSLKSFFEYTSKDTRLKMYDSITTVKILEPSMGVGVIYFEMYKTIYETALKIALYDGIVFEGSVLKSTIMSNIYGLDISKDALTLASGIKRILLSDGLKCDNRLFNVESSLIDIGELKTLMGLDIDFKFDIIIGNPPYVKSDRISDLDKGVIINYECHSPNADLLCYFFEQGCRLLKDNGVLCYITSNKWLSASYGVGVRKFILENYKVNSLYDFKDNRLFDGADVETCITMLEKEKVDTSYTFKYI